MKSYLKYLILLISVVACQKESLVTVQGFQSKQIYISETIGLENIIIDLGEGAAKSTDFTITISGTAGLEGDFIISSNEDEIKLANGLTKVSSINASITSTSLVTYTVQAGQKTLTIPIKIINDIQIEPGYETIQLDITDISDSNMEMVNRSMTIVLNDDDHAQNNELQIDLSWQLQSGGSINNSNFDLLWVTNVKFTSGSATDFELVPDFSSTKTAGFETLMLNESLADAKYYVMIKYVSGSSNSKVKVVISEGSLVRTGGSQISGSQVGGNFFYGPIYKSSTGFSYRTGSNEPSWYAMN